MMRKTAVMAALMVFLAGLSVTAFAAGTLTIAQETLLVLPNGDGFEGAVCAEVKNTGDTALQFTGGLFELFGKEGDSIGSRELDYYDLSPEVLLPGETGFLYSSIVVENAGDEGYIADYSLTLESTDTITSKAVRYPAEAFFQPGEGEFRLLRYAAAVVENKADETLRDFYAAFALKDASGSLLYIRSGTWASSGVMGHSGMEIRLKVDERVVENWVEKGIVPAAAEAIVFKTFPGD